MTEEQEYTAAGNQHIWDSEGRCQELCAITYMQQRPETAVATGSSATGLSKRHPDMLKSTPVTNLIQELAHSNNDWKDFEVPAQDSKIHFVYKTL